MLTRQTLDDFMEEKLLHTHTAFLGKVIKVNSQNDIDVQPLTLTQQAGQPPKTQALITGLSCIDNVWSYVKVGCTALCVVCERDITDARKGVSSLPARGRHNMKDSVIVGTIGSAVDANED
jgi:hypothetical protein